MSPPETPLPAADARGRAPRDQAVPRPARGLLRAPVVRTSADEARCAWPLVVDAALPAAISSIYGACDTGSDGVISRAEAEAVECRRHIFELLRRIPQPEEDPTAAQPAAAGSGGAASADAKAQQQAA